MLQPGKPSALYHRESNQEDFLVLAGRCLLLIEGEERPLKAWDFVHCPPETEHIFVGAGSCVIYMSGGRTGEKQTTYPRSELALRHRAGVETETSVPRDAYATFPKWQPGAARELGRAALGLGEALRPSCDMPAHSPSYLLRRLTVTPAAPDPGVDGRVHRERAAFQ